MGVAEYELVRALPEPLDTKLPSIEQLESELGLLSPMKPEKRMTGASLVEEDRLLDYRVQFAFDALALPSQDPAEYVVDVTGTILYDCDEREPANVGQIKAQLIQAGRAIDDGYPLEDVFDISDDTFQLYLALFDQRKRELKARLRSHFEVYGSDVLYLNAIEIHAAHRGTGSGWPLSPGRSIRWAQVGGSLVVCKPYPLQHDSAHADDTNWRDRIGVAGFAAEQATGTDKLRTYWSRLGFKKIRGTGYAALSTNLRRPSLEDALRPRR